MLANPKLFNKLEMKLRNAGIIEKYEQQSGKITGRMMITRGNLPTDLGISRQKLEEKYGKIKIFNASFDFCDTIFGVALVSDPLTNGVRAWTTPQTKVNENISSDFLQLFIKVLAENVNSDGSYDLPICTFITKNKEYMIVSDIVK